jgi:hypothetical protein
MAVPTRATPLGKPADAYSPRSTGPGAGVVGKTDPVPAQGQANDKDAPSAFNQLVDQIVAESTAAEAAPPSVVQAGAATAQSLKLPPKPAIVAADQLPDLPAPGPAIPARPIDPPILNAAPAGGRRADTRNAATSIADAPQPPVVAVDVTGPIPVAPKWQLPSLADGGSADQQPAKAEAASSVDEPPAIVLQPTPLLEVKIRLNQPAIPAVAASAQPPADTSFIQKQTTAPPTAPGVVKVDIVAPPVEALAVEGQGGPNLAAANPGFVAATAARSPVSTPAAVNPFIVTEPLAKPNAVVPVVATPAAASPVVNATNVTAAAANVPVSSQPSARGAAPDINGRPVAGSSAIQPATGNQQDAEGAAARQNPERGAPDPGDADSRPATEVTGHAASRTAANPEAPVVVQPLTPDAGSMLPLAHNSTNAAAGAVPVPPVPAPAPMTAREVKPEPPVSSSPLREESLIDQTKSQQPLRSLALEFTPDGAGDIKVRLSERGGDVHISLHGTDPSLAGRVREGVGDLVGSLSKAGYDAEAWTSDQGRQNQRQESEPRQAPRKTLRGTDADEFSGILQQPIQEIS